MLRYTAAALILARAVCGAAEERRFEHTNEHYTLSLPDDWKQVEAKSAPYAKDVLTSDVDLVSHAYHLASETNFAAVIFVEIDDTYRIPERDLARLQIDTFRKTFLADGLEPEGLRLLDSTFNTGRMEVRISATSDYAKTGKTRQLIGWFITEKGGYSVTCVAPIEHYKAVSEVFARTLDTFHIDPSLAYRARAGATKELASEGKTKSVKIRVGWVFGLVALVMLVVRRFTRVNSDEV